MIGQDVFFDTEVNGTSRGAGGGGSGGKLAYFNLFSSRRKHCHATVIKLSGP